MYYVEKMTEIKTEHDKNGKKTLIRTKNRS